MTASPSPNAPRPADPLVTEIADTLRRIEINYGREGSGPGTRFEGRLLEDVQAEAAVRRITTAERERCAQLAEQHGATYASYGTDLDPVRTRKAVR